jgi:hypothetical protein
VKRTTLLVVIAFLLLIPATRRASSQIENPAHQQKPSVLPEEAINTKFLFFKLPAPVSVKGPLNLEFRIRVDNLPYLVEKFTISPADARLSPLIELLATDPTRLKSLYKLAKGGRHHINLIVVIDSRAFQEFSFAELRAYNDKLKKQANFRPLILNSKLLVLRPLRAKGDGQIHTASSCEGDCYDQYANCAERPAGTLGWNATIVTRN